MGTTDKEESRRGAPAEAAAPADERAALGRELRRRAPGIGQVVNDRLREIMKLGPGDPLPDVNAAATSEFATFVVGRYLETGAAASAEEIQALAQPGSLALHATSITVLVKLYLAWRDAALLALRDAAGELGTAELVVRNAEEVVRSSCDASVVRMTKRFDDRRRDLERMLAEERRRLVHEARHDQLTGLVNRAELLARIREASKLHRRGEAIALMYLDLDGFKEVNDTHGHAFGDRLLQAVAGRLRELLRPSDIAGRFGGDEFVVCCSALGGGELAALAVAERLCRGFSSPFRVGGESVSCRASIGLACATGPVEPATLLARADAALYEAKRSGKATVRLG